MTIQPIETRYAGCRFRSRLEARWAVFFDAIKEPWEYEPQGFVIPRPHEDPGTSPYLPDFYLPKREIWVEVKGSDEALDKQLIIDAAVELGKLVVLGPIPKPPGINRDYGWLMIRTHGADCEFCNDGDDCQGCGASRSKGHRCFCFYDTFHMGVGRTPWMVPRVSPHLDENWVEPQIRAHWMDSSHAYEAARAARFEHGERP